MTDGLTARRRSVDVMRQMVSGDPGIETTCCKSMRANLHAGIAFAHWTLSRRKSMFLVSSVVGRHERVVVA
jgi:hypothetical protein